MYHLYTKTNRGKGMNVIEFKRIKPLKDYKKDFAKRDRELLIGVIEAMLAEDVFVDSNFIDTTYFIYHKASDVLSNFGKKKLCRTLNGDFMDTLDEVCSSDNVGVEELIKNLSELKGWLSSLA